MQFHAPVEGLAVHHVDQDQADERAQSQAEPDAERRYHQAFIAQHGADLATRHADVTQHAELAPARKGLRAEAHAHAEQPDQHRRSLQRVGDGEGAVEYRERRGAHFARRGDLDPAGVAQLLPQRACGVRQRRSFCQPQCRIVRQAVAGEFYVEIAVYRNGPGLPCVIAPHPGNGEEQRHLADRQAYAVPGTHPVKVGRHFGYPHRRGFVGTRDDGRTDQRQ